FPHPALAEILSDTYGVVVYQDQVLLILRHFAGYSLGRADIVRKAMGKKKADLLAAEKVNFIKGAEEKGFEAKAAEEIFALLEPFAGYAFNKAHATSYALISYQTAYLKANYPAQYMAAVLTAFAGVADKLAAMVTECGRLGVQVLPPDINKSGMHFTVEPIGPQDGTAVDGLAIRFGLSAIKNVGEGALEGLLAARKEGGEFASVEEFCRRADLKALNKRAMECLIKVGAFDRYHRRGGMIGALDKIMALAQREQKTRDSSQVSMFDLFGAQVDTPLATLEITNEDAGRNEKLSWEKDLLGVYLSEHPFRRHAERAAAEGLPACADVTEEIAGQ
ncbi:MAG: DNA polymerase III subunit alpha, partial [Chloroflexi bacterium]|nr:DNA polymerase III subunit alpha [Chloroflexota bacterium]